MNGLWNGYRSAEKCREYLISSNVGEMLNQAEQDWKYGSVSEKDLEKMVNDKNK
jgi:hypothetical protein